MTPLPPRPGLRAHRVGEALAVAGGVVGVGLDGHVGGTVLERGEAAQRVVVELHQRRSDAGRRQLGEVARSEPNSVLPLTASVSFNCVYFSPYSNLLARIDSAVLPNSF